uniref:Reverse transcriptase domain-containing protein n=1 Tax=Tanacetum cinerariifolium TaxID=118510 RepID=A0A699SK48_TANCI|nr:hypothetical protein [Tanacetum cinerariifolium]
MFPEELDEIERYVGGLLEMIRGNVMSYEPKSMQKAIESTNEQMDQRLLGIANRQADNKKSLTILRGTNKTNNHSEGTTMLHRPMLQGLEKNHTEESNLSELLTTTTITTTTREPQRQINEFLLALSVELRVITREIARGWETKIRGIKTRLGMEMLWQEHMDWVLQEETQMPPS